MLEEVQKHNQRKNTNKMGELKISTGMLVLIGIAVLLIGMNAGWFGGNAPNSNPSSDGTSNVPSTLGVTVTLNTRDVMSPTGANANVSYYIFDSDGKYVKEGTTSAGTADVTLNVLNSYKILTFGATTFAPTVTDYTVPSGKNSDTVAINLYPLSTPKMDRVQDSLGDTTDSNITLGLGQQKSFKIVYEAANASSQLYKPIIVVDYQTNYTASNGISISGLSAVTCPSRLTASAVGMSKVCFQDASLLSTSGPKELQGTILASSTITPESNDQITFTVVDTQMYADTNYKSVGLSAFLEGAQNKNDLSNVGRADSNSLYLTID